MHQAIGAGLAQSAKVVELKEAPAVAGRVDQPTPTVPGSTTTPDIARWSRWRRGPVEHGHVAAMGVACHPAARFVIEARQLPRHNEWNRANRATRARSAARCMPTTAFTIPWLLSIVPRIMLSNWLECIVSSLRKRRGSRENLIELHSLRWRRIALCGAATHVRRRGGQSLRTGAHPQASHGAEGQSSDCSTALVRTVYGPSPGRPA